MFWLLAMTTCFVGVGVLSAALAVALEEQIALVVGAAATVLASVSALSTVVVLLAKSR